MQNKYFEGEEFENISLAEEVFDRCEFIDCKFVNCSFEDCKVVYCNFSECKFIKCNIIGLGSEYSEVKFIEFDDCILVGINWSSLLPLGRFSKPIQRIVNCKLKYNTFSKMSFRKFCFSDSSITGSMFAECNLIESNFRKCDLSETEFFRCDISKADFRDSTGYRIDIMSNKMKGARFSYPEAINLLYSLGVKIE